MNEVEKVTKDELAGSFGAIKQHEGHWLSEDFKHFVVANTESDAGRFYNSRAIDQLLTMIKGSNAMQVDNVLEHIMYQIQGLLKKYLEKTTNNNIDTDNNNEPSIEIGTTLPENLDNPKELQVSRKGLIQVELELKHLSVEGLSLEPLWFIVPKSQLSDDVTLSKDLKFSEDGSVYIDYSSQFIPDVHIGQINELGDIQVFIECPSCSKSSVKFTVRGTKVIVQGEKFNTIMQKDYLNTRRAGKFELEVPVSKLDDERTFDFRKIELNFSDGIIGINIPVIRSNIQLNLNDFVY